MIGSPLDVGFCEILVDGRHVDTIECLGFLGKSFDDGLRLRHVAGSTHLKHAQHTHELHRSAIYEDRNSAQFTLEAAVVISTMKNQTI